MTRTKIQLILGLIVTAALVTVGLLVPVRDIADDLIGWVRSYGTMASVVYCCIFLLAAIVGFSRTVLTIIAGIIFEPVTALLAVIISSMAAFMTTFLLSRYFIADWVSRRLGKIPIAEKCMEAVEDQGFVMLVMMRLNPFIPAFVNGYGFGLTSIGPWKYLLASLLGSLPLILVFIYLGWAGGKAFLLGGAESETLEAGTLVFGVVVSVVTLVFISWYARRVITRSAR